MKRVFLIVLDSFGIGALQDAYEFSDAPTVNTLRSISTSKKFFVPTLEKLGLFQIDGVKNFLSSEQIPIASFGRLKEKSHGKDTTIGHWEIAGLVTSHGLPTFPDGFPKNIIEKLESAFGRKTLCHKPYSGTQVIHDFGQEHLKTGALIVYTSADSVLQIAAHESIVPREQLYEFCRQARKIMQGEFGVGRVIARPFIGEFPNYERTAGRHDFSLEPPEKTLLDVLHENNFDVISVGKIFDVFAGRGVTKHYAMSSNDEGMQHAMECLDENFEGLCFVNLVDFDMKFGHRRDVDGYAQAMTTFDKELKEFLPKMKSDDVLFITADHGCDPKAAGTDHTREHTPVLIFGESIKQNKNLGTRESFADIGATIAEMFHVDLKTQGKSFWQEIKK